MSTIAAEALSFTSATIEQMRARRGASLDFLWEGYLAPGNITLFTSQWKAGKTTLLSVLLKRMETGGLLAGLRVRPGRAIVISEEPEEHWLQRGQKLGLGPNVEFVCRPFTARPTPEQWQQLVDHLAQIQRERGIDLIVIDALTTFIPGRSEGDPNSFLELLQPMRPLARAGAAIWLIHHPRKGEVIEGQSARGSGVLPSFVDIIMEMTWFSRPSVDDSRRKIWASSRHDQTTRRLVIERTLDGLDYLARGDFDPEAYESSIDLLLSVFAGKSRRITRKDILSSWPEDHPKPQTVTLWRWLDRAVQEGKIAVHGTGLCGDPFEYSLPKMEQIWADDPYYLPPLSEMRPPYGNNPIPPKPRPPRKKRVKATVDTPAVSEEPPTPEKPVSV